jgi:tetratricopeptide (TPR) repeat protein
MPRQSSKWIAALISLLLIILSVAGGMLSGILTGHPGFSKYFNDHPWFPILLAIVGLTLLIFLLTAWQQGTAKEPATPQDVETAVNNAFEHYYQKAVARGTTPALTPQAKDAEIARLTQELEKLQQQLAAQPAEAELSKLLEAGDLDDTLRLSDNQLQALRAASSNLPRALYQNGIIHELRFEWPQALAAFREAWQLGHNPEHGFKYAHFAAKLNHHAESIAAFEALLALYTDPADRATALNNLANLLSATQRISQAEEAYAEALAIRRKLAEANPDTYMPHVAATLNNLANLFSETQRMSQAEEAYAEALAAYRKLAEANPDAFLADVAMTLTNLGLLYRDTQRISQAEESYADALAIRRNLAQANPNAYLPDVASTLNNFGLLYATTQRMTQAEEAYAEALAIRRSLAQANPDAYLPYVANTLNNLAVLYSDTQRIGQAEDAHDEAIAIRRKLAQANPDAYLPDVATTLNNLAILYRATQRMSEAERAYAEALAAYRKLAQANPDAYLPSVATTLNNLGYFFLLAERLQEASDHAAEAECILDPLWRANLPLHGNLMARILGTRSEIAEAARQPAPESCALARRALAAAHDPAIKQEVQRLIDRLCPQPD